MMIYLCALSINAHIHCQVYRCNDNVPEAVYWELPKRIQNQVKDFFCVNTGVETMECVFRLKLTLRDHRHPRSGTEEVQTSH